MEVGVVERFPPVRPRFPRRAPEVNSRRSNDPRANLPGEPSAGRRRSRGPRSRRGQLEGERPAGRRLRAGLPRCRRAPWNRLGGRSREASRTCDAPAPSRPGPGQPQTMGTARRVQPRSPPAGPAAGASAIPQARDPQPSARPVRPLPTPFPPLHPGGSRTPGAPSPPLPARPAPPDPDAAPPPPSQAPARGWRRRNAGSAVGLGDGGCADLRSGTLQGAGAGGGGHYQGWGVR